MGGVRRCVVVISGGEKSPAGESEACDKGGWGHCESAHHDSVLPRRGSPSDEKPEAEKDWLAGEWGTGLSPYSFFPLRTRHPALA